MTLKHAFCSLRHYGIAPDDFAVFFNFAYTSSICRKNQDGAASSTRRNGRAR